MFLTHCLLRSWYWMVLDGKCITLSPRNETIPIEDEMEKFHIKWNISKTGAAGESDGILHYLSDLYLNPEISSPKDFQKSDRSSSSLITTFQSQQSKAPSIQSKKKNHSITDTQYTPVSPPSTSPSPTPPPRHTSHPQQRQPRW